MPGPTTEVLSSDLEDLRADVQRVEVSLHDGLASVRADINAGRVGLAEFRAESRVMFRLIVGIGSALLVTAVLGLVSAVWWASSVNTDVHNLKASVAGLKAGLTPKQP